MIREQIIAQALRCIDEIYPEDNKANGPNFPLEDFIDEAGRRVLLTAPLHAISSVKSLAECPLRPKADGSGEIDLPGDFLRLARLRMAGWQRPILVATPEEHPLAALQHHPVTRGGLAKPIALLTYGGTKLSYYSVQGEHHMAEGEYIAYTGIDDTYPHKLIEVTAWILAGLVLGVSNEPNEAQAAEARATEMLSLL